MKILGWTILGGSLTLGAASAAGLEYGFASPLIDIDDFVISGNPIDIDGSFETNWNANTGSEIRTVMEFDISRRPRFGNITGHRLTLDPGGATSSGGVGGNLSLFSRVGNGVAEASDADIDPATGRVFSGNTGPIPIPPQPFTTELLNLNSIMNSGSPHLAINTFAQDSNRNVSLSGPDAGGGFVLPRVDTVLELPDAGVLGVDLFSDTQFTRFQGDPDSFWRLAAGANPLRVQNIPDGLEHRAQLEFDLRDIPPRTVADITAVTLELGTVGLSDPSGDSGPGQFEIYAFIGGNPITPDTAGIAERFNLRVGSFTADSADPVSVQLDTPFIGFLANYDVLRLEILETGSGVNYEFDAAGTSLSLAYQATVFPPMLAGDYNGDGSVNAADYTVWADNFGSTTDLRADGNDDGAVNAADYTIWADNFGVTASLEQPNIIPEPHTAGTLLILVMSRLTCRQLSQIRQSK
ncbi:MAG: dockerin type I domain-containing protein [Planctomycetota bacterium]